MIKTIIFDNGGVLVEDAWFEFVQNLEKKYGHKPGGITEKINSKEKLATRGEVTFYELMDYIAQILGSDEDLKHIYKPFDLKPEMVNLVKKISTQYEVALLTNEISSFLHDNDTWHMENIFGENIFRSSEIGFGKPDPEIYEYVLNKLNRKPEEIVFIDDREKNLVPARTMGINVIQFKSLEELKIELKEILKQNDQDINI